MEANATSGLVRVWLWHLSPSDLQDLSLREMHVRFEFLCIGLLRVFSSRFESPNTVSHTDHFIKALVLIRSNKDANMYGLSI